MPVAEFLYLSNEYNTHKFCVGNVCQKKRTVHVCREFDETKVNGVY